LTRQRPRRQRTHQVPGMWPEGLPPMRVVDRGDVRVREAVRTRRQPYEERRDTQEDSDSRLRELLHLRQRHILRCRLQLLQLRVLIQYSRRTHPRPGRRDPLRLQRLRLALTELELVL